MAQILATSPDLPDSNEHMRLENKKVGLKNAQIHLG